MTSCALVGAGHPVFAAPPLAGHWAGPERVFDGEPALASMSPNDTAAHASTGGEGTSASGYATLDASALRRGDPWAVGELSALHELAGGAALGFLFRVDAREQTMLGGVARVSVPLPRGMWLAPTAGVSGPGAFEPRALGGVELRSDRARPFGWGAGLEVSGWSADRRRVLGLASGTYRASRIVTLEERVGLGAWIGPSVAGDVALRWSTEALQSWGDVATYQRVTLARGPRYEPADAPSFAGAFSVDVAIGARRAFGPYGVAIELSEGAQVASYRRVGGALTVYAALF